ncbi:HNH endonuclease [Streptomyces resistomycificus]|uniref:HNH nuclease domain-containing protein n=1 Tax=Streptomyces resistomycificus TaxID=67356 RepID=A0A0L8L591_9ACTN|nr:HNH endonuclease [Streptomyces resistomycificus]KOG33322.1 hypothetical protein ADK37_23375 [Streptomyces resistomycificus]KUN99529.1 hypothetical protein AQJ84_11315 [Streptomyces resistomycificus]
MPVSKRLRYEILRRDNHTCRYCGASAPDVPLRVDHVTPVALGGTDEPTNLATSCEPCNSGKSSATVDSAVVAGVSDDALRWAAAMKQAAVNLQELEKPKDEYRDAFLAEWNRWHVGKDETEKVPLDDGWKQSIERFRVAGIPTWMWADIVDAAMANQKVKPDRTFRYVCGIAWNKVTALQAEARRIVGGAPAAEPTADSLIEAAVDVWTNEQFGEIDNEALDKFRASVQQLRKREDAHRVLYAAQHAAWFGEADATEALKAADREDALQQWTSAWLSAAGEYPDDKLTQGIQAQINTLLDADIYIGRVARAAAYAGSRRTGLLHFGLSEEEMGKVGVTEYVARVIETWAGAFEASSGRWPTHSERSTFLENLWRVGDGDIWIADLYPAATGAGAYQDPDLSTCLTRHLSVFEIAARPVGGEN